MDLLNEIRMLGCKPIDTPMDPGSKLGLSTSMNSADKGRHQHLVGKLIYLLHTRPNIAFLISCVSQFMHAPIKEDLEATYIILRYLKSSPGKGLLFKKGGQKTIEAYMDAD